MHSKILSMIGLARRAGKLSMGHDMALESLKKRKAKLIVFCSDVSPRLINEFEKKNSNVPIIKSDITMDEVHFSVGKKVGVMTVDDENFSKRLIELFND